MLLLYFVSFLLLINTAISLDDNEDSSELRSDPLIVETQSGTVMGRLDSTADENKPYYVFQGIPYAEPPIGSLRFQPPVPVQNWDGILNATEYRGNCLQLGNGIVGSEDCLHLNIYTPKTGNHRRLPVMVWIHGGGFTGGGGGKIEQGPDYFIEQNVIIVTINYRLHIFGFLSTGDLVVPGNNGLRDQALALLWVKNNIRAFGGDPKRITLFGHSAGAASIGYHLTARKTNGLYRNAILQSGTNLDPWSLSRRQTEVLATLFQVFNATSTEDLVNKMRLIDSHALTLVAYQIIQSYFTDLSALPFGPVIEPNHSGAYITGKSHELYSQRKFNHVPVIVGFTSLELVGAWSLISLLISTNNIRLVPTDLNLDSQAEYDLVEQKIKDHYFNNESISTQLYRAIEFASQISFVKSAKEFALLISKYVRVYFYVFSYMGNLGSNPERPFPGVGHAEELGYLWYRSSIDITATDRLVRSRLVKLWTNFAKKNYPTSLIPDPDLGFLLWPQARTIGRNLLYVNITQNLNLRLNPHKNDMEFWDEIYSEHGNPPFDTY